jgi:hypothetical protein
MSSQPLLVLNSLAQNTKMKVSIADKAAKSPLFIVYGWLSGCISFEARYDSYDAFNLLND